MNIRIGSPGWTISSRSSSTLLLERGRCGRGWHRIEVRLAGHGTRRAGAIYLRRTPDMPAVPLVATERAGRLELFFFSRSPVSRLHLEFRGASAKAREVLITIAAVGRLRALTGMMRRVSKRDRAKHIDPHRIYRKSWARWRRHGWEGCVTRLIREYQPPLLQWMLVEDPYQAWIEQIETPSPDAAAGSAHPSQLARQPHFELFLDPAGATDHDLRASIDAIVKQRYEKWTLSIDADALSPKLSEAVAAYADQEPRIRLRGAASPDDGDGFAGAVSAGDLVPEHALFEIARHLQSLPDAKVIYTDHDEIDKEDARTKPNFKPDWNPDLYLAQDYIGQLCLYRNDLLRAANLRFGEADDPTGRYFLFRCLPLLRPDEITHIPQVLYRRRQRPPRSDEDAAAVLAAGINARQDYLAASGQHGVSVEPGLIPNSYHVRYPLPANPPLVSLLIPTRDKRTLLETCVRSILDKTTYPNYEIIILDNQSQAPDTHAFFASITREDTRVRTVRYDRPFNYSAINNFGVQYARGEILGLINNDIEVISPEWLSEMVSHACRPEIGCVGAKLYYSNDTIQHGGVITGLWGVAGHAHKHLDRGEPGYQGRAACVQNFSAVTAACLVVRKEIFEQVGGLDAEHLAVSFNDVDFCLRVREAGYRTLWTPYAELYHHESISRGPEDSPQKKARELREINYMKSRWGHVLTPDPCYNPNLTQHMENFSVNIDAILFPHLRKV